MLKVFKYRIYPTKNQLILINKHVDASRFIYNLALETKKYAYNSNKINLSRRDLSAQLVDLKNEAYWLKEINSQSIQQSLMRLENAYKRFFEGSGFPRFKKKTDVQSFQIPQSVRVTSNKLSIPKFKEPIKIRVDRKHIGNIRSATVTKTPTNKYFVSILCETGEQIPIKKLFDPNTIVGIDLGLINLITLSTGEKIHNIRNMRNNQIPHLQRRLAKMKKRSNQKKRLQLKLNRKYEKSHNKRNDLLNKISTEITNRFDTVVIENLNVKGLMKNHKLARSIGETSWSTFVNMLEYKCQWKGKNIIKIDRFYASSKICSICGTKHGKLKLSEREWTCETCGTIHDRDVNAAINIKIWLVERQCQNVENSSVDERPSGPKKYLVCEALKVLDFGLETTKYLV